MVLGRSVPPERSATAQALHSALVRGCRRVDDAADRVLFARLGDQAFLAMAVSAGWRCFWWGRCGGWDGSRRTDALSSPARILQHPAHSRGHRPAVVRADHSNLLGVTGINGGDLLRSYQRRDGQTRDPNVGHHDIARQPRFSALVIISTNKSGGPVGLSGAATTSAGRRWRTGRSV